MEELFELVGLGCIIITTLIWIACQLPTSPKIRVDKCLIILFTIAIITFVSTFK